MEKQYAYLAHLVREDYNPLVLATPAVKNNTLYHTVALPLFGASSFTLPTAHQQSRERILKDSFLYCLPLRIPSQYVHNTHV